MSKYQALIDALAYAKQTGGIGLTASVADLDALLADLMRAEKALAAIAQQAQPVDELPGLNPEDFVVDVVLKHLGGFAPVTTHGVRVTHKPSRVSVVVDSERSQHRNRQLALEALRAIIRPQDHPVPAPSPQAPGRRKGPPGITLEPQGHEQPAVPVVSDEQIKETIDCIDWSQMVTADDYMYMIARAILALRPADHPDTQRCLKARNDLNAALHGEGALIDDLENAVANACAKLRRQAVEPMTDEVRRSYQCLLAMNTPHGFGDRIGPFVKWLQDSGITAKAEGGA